jgi:hypothetical protein
MKAFAARIVSRTAGGNRLGVLLCQRCVAHLKLSALTDSSTLKRHTMRRANQMYATRGPLLRRRTGTLTAASALVAGACGPVAPTGPGEPNPPAAAAFSEVLVELELSAEMYTELKLSHALRIRSARGWACVFTPPAQQSPLPHLLTDPRE